MLILKINGIFLFLNVYDSVKEKNMQFLLQYFVREKDSRAILQELREQKV